MTNNEFIKILENHDDIMMHCDNFKFTIMTCYEELLICEQQTNDVHYYPSASEMLNNYNVNGKTLNDVLKNVVLDRCS